MLDRDLDIDINSYIPEIFNYVSEVSEKQNEIQKDDEITDSKKERDKLYTKIVSDYEDVVIKNYKAKLQFKFVSFYVTIALMCAITATFILVMLNAHASSVIDYIQVGATIVSFLAAFITLPKIMTKYIFNKDEDEMMHKFISDIRDSDLKSNNFYDDAVG